ncbi:hypothetical protein J6E39_05060 [bacterium]|nr:hypothetical protein [bacterium]
MTPPINNKVTIQGGRNLETMIRNHVRQQGGKEINQKELTTILGRLSELNNKRFTDSDPNNNVSIFKGGSNYGGSGAKNFVVDGKDITLSDLEANYAFEGILQSKAIIDPLLKRPTIKDVSQQMNQTLTNGIKAADTSKTKLNQSTPIKLTTDQIKHSQKRSVDGEKQNIIEIKGEDGTKKMHLVNDDGTLGEELIKQTGGSLFGKSTYVTKSKVDAQVRTMLGLKDGQSIPEGINPKYEQDTNGNPQLVLNDANGNRLDSNAIKDLLAKNTEAPKEQAAPQKTVVLGKMEIDAESAKKLMTQKANPAPEAKPAPLQNVNNYMQAAQEQVQPKNEDLITANPENLQDEDTSMYNT